MALIMPVHAHTIYNYSEPKQEPKEDPKTKVKKKSMSDAFNNLFGGKGKKSSTPKAENAQNANDTTGSQPDPEVKVDGTRNFKLFCILASTRLVF